MLIDYSVSVTVRVIGPKKVDFRSRVIIVIAVAAAPIVALRGSTIVIAVKFER